MSAMWEAGSQGTATGPSIIVGGTEVIAYWSDDDGVRFDIAGKAEDLTADELRVIADAMRQMADTPAPE